MRQLLSDIALIPDNDRRGKTFERAVKWLLENAPETRNQFKKVWLWDDYPDRGGGDLGIDLVAETLQGTRWAILAQTPFRVTRRGIEVLGLSVACGVFYVAIHAANLTLKKKRIRFLSRRRP